MTICEVWGGGRRGLEREYWGLEGQIGEMRVWRFNIKASKDKGGRWRMGEPSSGPRIVKGWPRCVNVLLV